MANTPDLISIATFQSAADAQAAKRILDEVGIDVVIRTHTSSRIRASRGVEILVSRENVHPAIEALHRRHRWPT